MILFRSSHTHRRTNQAIHVPFLPPFYESSYDMLINPPILSRTPFIVSPVTALIRFSPEVIALVALEIILLVVLPLLFVAIVVFFLFENMMITGSYMVQSLYLFKNEISTRKLNILPISVGDNIFDMDDLLINGESFTTAAVQHGQPYKYLQFFHFTNGTF